MAMFIVPPSFYPVYAFLSSLGIGIITGPFFMRLARQFFRAPSREFTPDGHRAKNGVATMGGLYILGVFIIASLFWCGFSSFYLIMLVCITGFGFIGFIDDWSKINQIGGIWARTKFIGQWAVAGTVALLLYFTQANTAIHLSSWSFDIGLLYIPWAMLILVATSNAVNLTDGLDGLATSILIPNFFFYGAMALFLPHLGGSIELGVMAGAFIGSLLCFLWLNAHPANLFMGDIGSLPLGAAVALMALMIQKEILLVLTGFIFVAETVSVMLQVFWYKRTKTRIFKMAPIHHHFELSGWSEVQIMVRASIITIVLCVIALLLV